MAAGGWKIFTAGDVLTADDTMDYLQQGVLVFDSSGARGSAIASPAEGQFSYLKDTDATEYYDGASWTPVAQGGLVHIVTESFSAVSSVSLDNCFSGDYDNYRVLVRAVGSASVDQYLRLRASGADFTSSNYNSQRLRSFSTTNSGNQSLLAAEFNIGGSQAASNPIVISAEVFSPNRSEITSVQTRMTGFNSAAATYMMSMLGGEVSVTTVFDGLTFYPTSGTTTGTISVYGYKS